MKKSSVHVILNEQVGLLGAAHHALRRLEDTTRVASLTV